jgi:hypothetical protein
VFENKELRKIFESGKRRTKEWTELCNEEPILVPFS